jgi:hypothetical protein
MVGISRSSAVASPARQASNCPVISLGEAISICLNLRGLGFHQNILKGMEVFTPVCRVIKQSQKNH